MRNYKKEAKIFKSFCDENRLQILEMLQSGEKCACKLLEALQISQPTLSHHMQILCDAGIVNGRKEGKWIHYSINKEGAEQVKKMLADFLVLETTKEEENCCCCNEEEGE